MSTAPYEYTPKDDRTYPWGVVRHGDIAYFQGRPPDGNWTLHVAIPIAATEEDAPTEVAEATAEPEGVEVKRPNLNAPYADWMTYAKAEGSYPGTVDEATRKSIIEHYTGSAEQ